MGDREIKSSIELAMEKLAQMPRATSEELAEQRRKELCPLGRALAMKLLEGRMRAEQIEAELRRHGEEGAPIVKEALLCELKGSFDLENPDRNEHALEALKRVAPDIDATELRARTREVLQAYQAEKRELERQFEREYRADLQKRGVSGSALRPNLRDSRGLRIRLQQPRQVHGEQLASLLDRFLGR